MELQSKILSREILHHLYANGKSLGTAESCTGGSISKRITDISGASGVFDCGVCSYGNNIKSKVFKNFSHSAVA